jgi:hypothetical protein
MLPSHYGEDTSLWANDKTTFSLANVKPTVRAEFGLVPRCSFPAPSSFLSSHHITVLRGRLFLVYTGLYGTNLTTTVENACRK